MKMIENILAIIKEILQAENVHDTDNFFLLGGDSMKAVQLSQRIRMELGMELSILSIFQKPVIKDIVANAERARKLQMETENREADKRFDDISVKGLLSYEQEGIWIHEAMYPSDYFRLTGFVSLEGEIDTEVLSQAVKETIACHDMLRAFIQVNPESKPELVIEEQVSKGLEVQELSNAVSKPKLIDYMKKIGHSLGMEQIRQAYRIVYLKTETKKNYLVLAIHHAFSDEMTFRILVREIFTRYQGTFQEKYFPKRQYLDYITWQRRKLDVEPIVSYWKEKLADGKNLFLDLPYANTGKQGRQENAVNDLDISHDKLTMLIRQAKEESITTHNLFLAAFKVLIYKLTGCKTISVGTPVSCKKSADYDTTCGLFVNESVSIDRVREEESFLTFCKRVQETMLLDITHSGLPYEAVIRHLNNSKELLALPNRIHYNFIDESESKDWQQDLSIGSIHFIECGHLCDFGLIVELVGSNCRVSLVSNESYLSKEALNLIGQQFERLLENLAAMGYHKTVAEILVEDTGLSKEEITDSFSF